jgi:hypothetical protein
LPALMLRSLIQSSFFFQKINNLIEETLLASG